MFYLYICYLCYLDLCTQTGVQHDFHIWWCACRLAVKRGVPIVEQKLLSFWNIWIHPRFLIKFVLLNLSFLCSVLFTTYHCLYLFSFFVWPLYCLPFELWLLIATAFSILKLFLLVLYMAINTCLYMYIFDQKSYYFNFWSDIKDDR